MMNNQAEPFSWETWQLDSHLSLRDKSCSVHIQMLRAETIGSTIA